MSTRKKSNAPALIAYTVEKAEGAEKAYWRRVGAAWKNKAGGYQLRLGSLPVGGELVLLPPREAGNKGAA